MSLSLFLSYAHEDRRRVRTFYRRLKQAGLEPWMDQPPSPWTLEGLKPGEEWEPAIRRQISSARFVLALLSRRSVAKTGYVQRELRLALSAAMERPANAIQVVPVLLEACSIPDLRVDTLSLRHLQAYHFYAHGFADLLKYLGAGVGSLAPIQVSAQRNVTRSASDLDSIRTFVASFGSIQRSSTADREAIADAVYVEIGKAVAGDLAGMGGWNSALDPTKSNLNLRTATAALHTVRDPTLALTLAAIAARHQRHRAARRASRTLVTSWLSHPSPDVGAIAALLLARPRSCPTSALEHLANYTDRADRLPGAATVLRGFVSIEALPLIARHAPTVIWETLANDPHFGGMGQTHIPMRSAGKHFSFLLTNNSWKAREVGAAIFAGDRGVSLEPKLRLLADPEPRVRFRALEGILLNLHDSDASIELVLQHLAKNGPAQSDDRTWLFTPLQGTPRLFTAFCSTQATPPTEPTSYFGHSGQWDTFEWLHPASNSLTGLVVAYPDPSVSDYLDRERAAFQRLSRQSAHWALAIAARVGLARIADVRRTHARKGA